VLQKMTGTVQVSRITPAFRRLLQSLPTGIQKAALRSFKLWRKSPDYPSVNFTRMCGVPGLFSARINGYSHRALARKTEDGRGWLWFWIGTHADYDRLLRKYEMSGLPPFVGASEADKHRR
jgi:hypothetical protein